MRESFRQAKRVYKQGTNTLEVRCINGCCYGRQPTSSEHKGDYEKLCGQRFWEFITGDPEIYTRIIDPIGIKARERNEQFHRQYECVVDAFTEEFRREFCDQQNAIKWETLVEVTSGQAAR
jgi:hypothetical protein